ncbi:MAG: Zn-ribbon domain-containing OB-fold protein [Candidatus Thermoplasmatota archaeon]
MTFFEKITDPRDLTQWKGNMEAHYLYTSGQAGEDFFDGLKEGNIIANECPECGTVYVPPRLYCEDCFVEIPADYMELEGTGTIDCYTIAKVDTYDEELENPEIWAIIKMDGADSGFTHKVDADPDEVEAGDKVKAVLKPEGEREGKITDIEHFIPV